MFGVDPTGKHEEHAEEHEEITGRNEGKHSTNKESVTQVLDQRTQRDTLDPKSTKVRIQRNRSSSWGGLEIHEGIFPRGGLESDRIFSEEAAVSHEEEIQWMSEALPLIELNQR